MHVPQLRRLCRVPTARYLCHATGHMARAYAGTAGGGEDMWHRVQAQEGVIKELLRRCSQLEARERSRNEPAEGSAAHEYRMNLVAYQVIRIGDY